MIGKTTAKFGAEVVVGICTHGALINGGEPRAGRKRGSWRHTNVVASPDDILRGDHSSFRRERSRRISCGWETRHFGPVAASINSSWGLAGQRLWGDTGVGVEQAIDFGGMCRRREVFGSRSSKGWPSRVIASRDPTVFLPWELSFLF